MSNTLKLGNGKWATGKDTLLSFSDTNNNYKPLPFSFSRASSGTVVNKDGLIETVGSGQARIDFKDNTKGSLLLEPSRSNLVLTSASGTYQNPPASETNTISPDGTNNAVIPTPDSNYDRYGYNISSGAYETNTKLAYSWYRKRISTPINTSYIGDLYMNALVNVTQVGSTTQIESDINGFDRFQAIFNITDGSASSTIRAYFGSVIGAGNSSIAYWGHQLEQGSYATSYIPTSGSAATRVADSSSQTPPDGIIGQTEGSIYSEFKCLDGISNIILWMRNPSGGSYGDMIKLEVRTNNVFQLEIKEANDPSANITSSALTVGNYYKVAVGYKQNDFVVYINGVQIGVDTSGSVPTCSEMYIGKYVDGGIRMGVVKDLKLYNTRLSNSELQALTQ